MMAITFFTQSIGITMKPNFKSKQHRCDNEYIKKLKQCTKCFKCGEFGHWSTECPHPVKKKKHFVKKWCQRYQNNNNYFFK
jgi:hypothetical protein